MDDTDARMVEFRCEFRFSQKPLPGARGEGELLAQKLEGDLAVELLILCEPNAALPATP